MPGSDLHRPHRRVLSVKSQPKGDAACPSSIQASEASQASASFAANLDAKMKINPLLVGARVKLAPSQREVTVKLKHWGPGACPLFATALAIIVTVFLFVITWVSIPVTGYSTTLSNTGRNVYTVGTTLLGGIIAAFIISSIKDLWIMDVLFVTPAEEDESMDVDLLSRSTSSLDSQKPIKRHAERNRHVLSSLGLGPFRDHAHYWPETASMLIAGLLTTGIVAGLAPQVFSTTRPAPQWAWMDTYFWAGNQSATITPVPPPSEISSLKETLTWKMQNGSWISFNQSIEEPAFAINALEGPVYDTSDPARGTAYTVGGMPIVAGAVGIAALVNSSATILLNQLSNYAPADVHHDYSGLYGAGQLVSSEACMPVFASNPAKCRQSCEPLFWNSYSESKNFGNCFPNGTGLPDIGYGVCTEDRRPGQATFVFAAQDSDGMSFHFSGWTDSLVSDAAANATQYPMYTSPTCVNGTDIVACDVDLRPVVKFQKTRLEFLGQLNGDSPQRQEVLKGATGKHIDTTSIQEFALSGTGEDCIPKLKDGTVVTMDDFYTDWILGWTIANTWSQISNDNSFEELMYGYTGDPDGKNISYPGYFSDSRIVLDEVLGASLGQSFSQYVGAGLTAMDTDWYDCIQGSDYDNFDPDIVFPGASVATTSMRIGQGQWWAFICALPSLYCTVVLCVLLHRRLRFAERMRREHLESVAERKRRWRRTI